MNVHFIGIAGPSCSGKTELARWLSAALRAPIIPVDCYYRRSAHLPLDQRAGPNFDAPEAIERELLIGHLQQLASGASVAQPKYDFGRHLRLPDAVTVSPSTHVIVEGSFTLMWEDLRRMLTTKVYVDASPEVCSRRRLARDLEERERTPESVQRQYEEHVYPMAQQHILPTRDLADLVVSGDAPISETGREVLMVVRNRQVFQTPHYRALAGLTDPSTLRALRGLSL